MHGPWHRSQDVWMPKKSPLLWTGFVRLLSLFHRDHKILRLKPIAACDGKTIHWYSSLFGQVAPSDTTTTFQLQIDN